AAASLRTTLVNVSEAAHGAASRAAPLARHGYMRPAEPRGIAATGRIVKLLVGRGQGFIRVTDGREVFFHRSDIGDGISFNDFAVGNAVNFEVIEDPVSGARALRVRPKPMPR